jgi:hypothetical protein
MLTDEERRTLIHLALGKASLGFMTQPEGANVVMPTEHLLDVAKDIDELWSKDVATERAARVKAEERFWYVAACLWGDRDLSLKEDPDSGEWVALVVNDYDGKPEREIECDGTNQSLYAAIDRALREASGRGEKAE